MTGYSGTPLAKKLGIKEGMTVAILNSEFEVPDLPAEVVVRRTADPADLFVIFSTEAVEMEGDFIQATRLIPPDGAIWTAWPKKSSGVDTDITEDTLRALFLPTGMVDNKVCAIDDTWSGLRFVVRKERRAEWRETVT